MKRSARLVLILSLLLAVLAALSLVTGRGGHWLALPSDETEARLLRLILWELRLPRLVLALLVGAALGLSGAVLQGLTRNPLLGLAGAFGATALTLALGGGGGVLALILAGAAVSGLMLAGTALVLNLA